MRSERRERRREADREDLLAAAERVFSRVGYAGASVRDIAREAGISVGGVYQFFESKDDLYVAALERLWTGYQAALSPALAHGSFDERLRAVTEAWVSFFAARGAFLSVLLAERGSFSRAFHDRVARVVTKQKRLRRRQIVELMKDGAAERRLRFDDAEMLASAYLGLVSQCSMDALGDPKRPLPGADTIVSLLCQGICRPAA